MLKKTIGILTLSVMLAIPATTSAKEGESFTNPEMYELDELMTELALDYEIPPEIVKSVAKVESALKQFNEGEPNIASDGGIGIMQVTDDRFDQDRLAEDIAYNIESGIILLQEKQAWAGDVIPQLDDAQWYHLESWYFPVMAYNGLVHANSPIIRADESHNTDAYQERVFSMMSDMNNGLQITNITDAISLSDLDYRDNNRLSFTIDNYELPEEYLTQSRYLLEEGQKTIINQDARLRSEPSQSSDILDRPNSGTIVTLTSGYLFDQTYSINRSDQNFSRLFPWFQVTLPDESTGYIAGGLIDPVNPELVTLNETVQDPVSLTDIDTHWARGGIKNLADAGIIGGYSDGSFRPNNDISRQEFTHLTAQLLEGVPEGINTSWTFFDEEPPLWALDSIMTAYQFGVITGFSDGSFQPEENVTRAQIAVMIERLLELTHTEFATQETTGFSDDLPEWAADAIVTVNGYGIINGYDDGTFRPNEPATRAEVAAILHRVLQ